MNRGVVFTDKQKELLVKVKEPATKHLLAVGGSRSGKSYAIVEWVIRKCITHPELRALIARHAFSHAKSSIWGETIKSVLRKYRNLYGAALFKVNESDLLVTFKNGAELHVAGLDDAERMEKILGREFAIIYLNECSQISYDAVTMCKTRLAQVIPGFKNKMLYDENPPAPTHWTHRYFIEKIDPKSGDPITDADYIFINPADNMANLDPDYIKTLESLPDRDRRRFLYGEFVKIEGAIYDSFGDKNIIDYEDVPPIEYFTVGVDSTGNNLAAILVGWAGDNIYLLDEYSAYRAPITEFANTIYTMWGQYDYIAYCDPAAGALNDYFHNSTPADNSVAPGMKEWSIENPILVRGDGFLSL